MDEDVEILMSMYQMLSREDIDAALVENGLTATGAESSRHMRLQPALQEIDRRISNLSA